MASFLSHCRCCGIRSSGTRLLSRNNRLVVFVMISQDPPHPQGHQPRSRFLQKSIQYSIQFHEYLIGGSCLLYFLRSFPSSFSTGFKENVVRIRNIIKRHKILRVIKNRVIETGTYILPHWFLSWY